MEKEEIIKRFKMIPHVEGGYFKETYHSSINYENNQSLYSSILFLLGENDISHLHVLKEDELWYYQGGDDCTIIELDENLNYKEIKLGINSKDSTPQYLVKKGHIFASKYSGKNYTLVGCMVSPSFTYEHFKLVKKEDLEGKISEELLMKLEDMFAK
mgnify:CR=1 FL=1